MNHTIAITLERLRNWQFSVLAVMLGMGLLFTAANAKAGCALPYKAGPPPPLFLSSALIRRENRTSMRPSWDCGMSFTLQRTMLISLQEALSLQHPSCSHKPSKHGTRMELNLKTPFCPPQAASATGSGRSWVRAASSCTISAQCLPQTAASQASSLSMKLTPSPRTAKHIAARFEFKLWPPIYEAVGVGVPISEAKGTTAATRITVD